MTNPANPRPSGRLSTFALARGADRRLQPAAQERAAAAFCGQQAGRSLPATAMRARAPATTMWPSVLPSPKCSPTPRPVGSMSSLSISSTALRGTAASPSTPSIGSVAGVGFVSIAREHGLLDPGRAVDAHDAGRPGAVLLGQSLLGDEEGEGRAQGPRVVQRAPAVRRRRRDRTAARSSTGSALLTTWRAAARSFPQGLAAGLRAGGGGQDRSRDRQGAQRRRLPDQRQPRGQSLLEGHRPPHPDQPLLCRGAPGWQWGWVPGRTER